jgi:(2R)-ethylmalonyl-CoA mutase
MEVVYEGVRLTPAQIAGAVEGSVHVVGLSTCRAASHAAGREVMSHMRKEGLDDVPVVSAASSARGRRDP